MDVADIMYAEAKGIYETKKELLERDDDTTVRQVDDAKDVFGLLSTFYTSCSD